MNRPTRPTESTGPWAKRPFMHPAASYEMGSPRTFAAACLNGNGADGTAARRRFSNVRLFRGLCQWHASDPDRPTKTLLHHEVGQRHASPLNSLLLHNCPTLLLE